MKATKSRLTVGGYGEAVYSHHFYSDNVFRYSHADRYKDAPGYGRVDLPHAVIMLGYDFGHGWSVGTEIEFEHGGVEAAVEKETEETGEFEQEVERGGEVALEQFWVQKSFNRHVIVRGNVDYGHLSDAAAISARNKNQTTMTGNPYPHTFVGEAAWDASIEAGIDLLSFAQWRRDHGKLYLFGRYDQYDSYIPASGLTDIGWCSRQVVSGGVNFFLGGVHAYM